MSKEAYTQVDVEERGTCVVIVVVVLVVVAVVTVVVGVVCSIKRQR